jgi:hypothetical protein
MDKEKKAVLIWQIAASVLLIACIIMAGFIAKSKLDSSRSQKVAQKAVEYINKNLVDSSSQVTFAGVESTALDIGKLYAFGIQSSGNSGVAYVSSEGKYLILPNSLIDMKAKASGISAATDKNQKDAEGGFKEMTDVNICKEGGKPSVYFFGLASSKDSVWEYPIFKDIVSKFGDAVVFHDNYLSENGLTKDQDIFTSYSTGTVPTLVIGCKYYRLSSGEAQGETAERAALTKLICDATGNQPASVCNAK